jgi:t-SNARE complex subunit (syntaxin)
MYDRIDDNMVETTANVEGAQGELLKYLNNISSNRWLLMKIFFVLMVLLMIFIFFVACSPCNTRPPLSLFRISIFFDFY